MRRSLFMLGALWAATSGVAAAADDFEITLRVLDEVADVDRVVAAVRREVRLQDDARGNRAPAREEDLPAGPSRISAAEEHGRHGDLATVLDREEESEGEIEDDDVPVDFEIPPAEEDEDEE